jgi:hypothetical protein
MSSSYLPHIYEVVILVRDKATGKESSIKFEQTIDFSVETRRESDLYDYFRDPVKLYPPNNRIEFTIEGTATSYHTVTDTSKLTDEEREKWL